MNFIHGYHFIQIFWSKKLFCEVYLMEAKSDTGIMLDRLIRMYGAPEPLVFDGSK